MITISKQTNTKFHSRTKTNGPQRKQPNRHRDKQSVRCFFHFARGVTMTTISCICVGICMGIDSDILYSLLFRYISQLVGVSNSYVFIFFFFPFYLYSHLIMYESSDPNIMAIFIHFIDIDLFCESPNIRWRIIRVFWYEFNTFVWGKLANAKWKFDSFWFEWCLFKWNISFAKGKIWIWAWVLGVFGKSKSHTQSFLWKRKQFHLVIHSK